MRIRIPASFLAILAIGLGIAAGAYLAYAQGLLLEAREPAASAVSAPRVTDVPLSPVGGVVRMTPQQYVPGTVHVGRGEVVRFENAGVADQWPVADDAPSPDGIVVAGESWHARFTERGTFIYRDRVYPQVGATIVVD